MLIIEKSKADKDKSVSDAAYDVDETIQFKKVPDKEK